MNGEQALLEVIISNHNCQNNSSNLLMDYIGISSNFTHCVRNQHSVGELFSLFPLD